VTDAEDAARVLDALLRGYGTDVAVQDEGGFRKYGRVCAAASPSSLRSVGSRRGDARLGVPFAVVRVLTSRVDVAFRRWSRARSKRVLDARAAGMPHLPYRVIVEAPGDLDTELRAWLRESYEIGAP
jgi:hypothetical protein